MKNLKRLFAVVLSIALVLCAVPMVASAEIPTIPEMSTTYTVIDSSAGQWSSVTVPANADMYHSNPPAYRMAGWNPKNFESAVLTKTEFVEMDVYVSSDVAEGAIGMWISRGWDSASVRGKWVMPALTAGWNHVVTDVTTIGGNGGFSFNSYDVWNSRFWEGVASTTEDVTIAFGNVALTTDVDPNPGEPDPGLGTDPEVVPTPEYNANVVQTSDVDLKGSKTNTVDERYFTWNEYSTAFESMMNEPLVVSAGDYIEFDFYSDIDTTLAMALGSRHEANGFQFYDNRSKTKSFDVVTGWNHVVLTTDGAYREADVTSLGSYTADRVTGFIIRGCASGYIRLTNIAVTRETPLATSTYQNPIIDFADSTNATKTWDSNVTNIYNVVANRLFIGLGKTIDISKAEYIEFDIWADAPMQDLTMWICNRYDGTGRFRNNIKFSELVTPGQWNHIVWDLSNIAYTVGTMDRTMWTSVFFEGDPNAAGIELTVKIANLGCSKSYPDMNNTHTLVATAVEGVALANTPTTVPAGSDMYPSYQMWQNFNPIDMSNVDFIEMDIYASAPTENVLKFHTATDVAALRGWWNLPLLNEGWNHVVLDKVKDYGGSASGMTIDQLTSWRGYFFQDIPSTTNAVTFKVANVAATKFAPDPNYTYIEVTSHPEIADDVTTTDALDTTATFNSAVDFSKGDSIELDVYVSEAPASDITVVLTDINGVTANLTLAAADVAEGWNHIVLDLAKIVAGEGFAVRSVASIGFTGAALTAVEGTDFRFAYANLALTAEEAVKLDMEYTGKVVSKFAGYTEVTISAGADIAEATTPIALPVAMDLTGIDYIEMNLYVSAKCDLILNLNSTPADVGEIYTEDDGYYELSGLAYGWNQIHVPVSELVANEWFDPTAVTHIYFSGVPAATYDVTFTVEDLAVTSASLEFDIVEGDYNVDNAVDMRDLIHVVNASLAEEAVWFANAAEVKDVANGIIDASDITALRKLLFASF